MRSWSFSSHLLLSLLCGSLLGIALRLTERSSLRVFVSGPPESGKSQFLAHEFTSRTPRVISIDITGETAERNPDAIRTYGLEDLRSALKKCASYRRWHVAARLDEKELGPTFAMLAPAPKSDEDISFPRAVGGLAIECGETAFLAPNGRTAPDVKAAWNRGRHHLLSLYMATQRPAEVDRAVTASSPIKVAFGHREDRDLEFWRKEISAPIAELISELTRYHSIFYVQAANRVYVRDGSYRVRRILDARGNEVSRARPKLVRQS
jgi:hypothetical protein